MEAEIRLLKEQAQATQDAIKTLQTREPTDPVAGMLSGLPTLPVLDTTLVGVLVVLGAALTAAWWYLWHRPQTRLAHDTAPPAPLPQRQAPSAEPVARDRVAAPPVPVRTEPAAPPYPPAAAPRQLQEAATPLPEWDLPTPDPWPQTPFSRAEQPVGFDQEAAANEVMRVRKSLAEKREARSLLRERDEELQRLPTPPIPPREPVAEWHAPELSDPDDFLSRVQPPEPGPEPLLHAEPDIVLDLELEFEPQPQPEPAPPTQPERPAGPDHAITLALAQESAALELWHEARELAHEVLEAGDPDLQEQAQALLAQIETLEQHAQSSDEAITAWNSTP